MKRTNTAKQYQRMKLCDIAKVVNGTGFPERFQGRTELSIPYVKVSDMNSEGAEITVSRAVNTVSREMLSEMGAKTCPAGTTIFPKVGGALLTNKKRLLGVEAAFDNNVMGVIPTHTDSEWLYYWLLTVDLRLIANTQALPSIRQSDVCALELEVPSKDEQQRVAAQLRVQLAEVERARAAAQAQLDAAQILPAALLRDVFDSRAAKKWPLRRLGDSLVLRKEIIHPSEHPKGPAIFIGLEHIESQLGNRIGGINVEMAELTGRKPRFRTGDIVYGYLRPYLNKVWVADFDGLCSVDQYAYAVRSEIADTRFIAWFMRSPCYLERAPIGDTPGQLPRIRLAEVAAVQIGLPPLAEQRAVSKRIEAEIEVFTALRESLQTRLSEIELLPAALLRSAFKGN